MPDELVVKKICPQCGAVFYGDGEPHYCFKCNVKLKKTYEGIKPAYVYEKPVETVQYVPRCPTCGSPNVFNRGNGAGKTVYGLMVHKQYVCNNCGYEW